jgi:hypothetical protein
MTGASTRGMYPGLALHVPKGMYLGLALHVPRFLVEDRRLGSKKSAMF